MLLAEAYQYEVGADEQRSLDELPFRRKQSDQLPVRRFGDFFFQIQFLVALSARVEEFACRQPARGDPLRQFVASGVRQDYVAGFGFHAVFGEPAGRFATGFRKAG